MPTPWFASPVFYIYDFCTSGLKENACLYEIGTYFDVLRLASEIYLFTSAKPSPKSTLEACQGNWRTAVGSVEAALYSQDFFLICDDSLPQ